MADKTGIGWTNATWNPVRGCERVSPGCVNCYAEVLAARHSYEGGWGYELAEWVKRPGGKMEARWTGVIQIPNHAMKAPLGWRTPRRVFVNSMSDLFHDRVPFNVVDNVYAIMEKCQQHTFQILTKRPARMVEYTKRREADGGKVLPNVWHGVSTENQQTADERIPLLLQVPSLVHWISAEPLLGPIDLLPYFRGFELPAGYHALGWVVVGAESGQDHRPMAMEHARSIIELSKSCNVPVFVKQDNGPRPGMKGRFTAAEWALKEYPA